MNFPGSPALAGGSLFSLDDWVGTPENRLATAAVRRVGEDLASRRRHREVNPLVLHGPPGTGKSHLVQALASDVASRRPDRVITVLAAADLRADLDLLPRPREPDPADLLVIEDVQHLPEAAAEPLCALLDARAARHLQTVVTASCGPARLDDLPARLRGRLAGGLVVGLEPLAPASRRRLLEAFARRKGLALDADALDWLAQHTGPSARQLGGAITRAEALARAHGRPPGPEALAAAFADQEVIPSVERIAERVGRYFQVETKRLRSRRRGRDAMLPRQVGMYLARRLTPLSLGQIGAYFGGRDHTTVLHACRKVEQAMAQDTSLSGAVRELHADLA